MKQDKKLEYIIMFIIGIILIIWLALITAPFIDKGFIKIFIELPNAIKKPFSIKFCENSIRTILIFLTIYILGIGIYFSTRKNYKKGIEHGSAKWGNYNSINKKYEQKPKSENRILTQHIRLGLNAKRHRRNLNTLICGGSRCR